MFFEFFDINSLDKNYDFFVLLSKSLWDLILSRVIDVHAYPTSPTTFMRRTPRLIKKILLDKRYDHLIKVRWNGHLVNYLPLIYRYGINMNILHLTFFFVQNVNHFV